MDGKNWLLVTNEPVKFEKQPAQIQDFKKITDPFRAIYTMFLNVIKKNWKMPTYGQLALDLDGLCQKVWFQF